MPHGQAVSARPQSMMTTGHRHNEDLHHPEVLSVWQGDAAEAACRCVHIVQLPPEKNNIQIVEMAVMNVRFAQR